MTTNQIKSRLTVSGEIVPAPALLACDDRTFDLPPGLHIATAVMFLGFISVLSLAFRSPALAVPFGIFMVTVTAFFTVPALWARMNPADSRARSVGWSEFLESGIDTASGHSNGGSAAVLVLMLPFLILCWSVAVAIIAALV